MARRNRKRKRPPGKSRTTPAKTTLAKANTTSASEFDARALLASLSDKQRRALGRELSEGYFMRVSASSYSGPLPRPQDFREYEEILPGAADRILSMAEREQSLYRMRINRATLLGFSLIPVAGLAVWLGQTEAAILLGIIGPVMSFLRQIITWITGRNE